MNDVVEVQVATHGGAEKNGISVGGLGSGVEFSLGVVTFDATSFTIEYLPGGGQIHSDYIDRSEAGIYFEAKTGDGYALVFERGLVYDAEGIASAAGLTVGPVASVGPVSVAVEIATDTGLATVTTSFGVSGPGVDAVATAASVYTISELSETPHSVPSLVTEHDSFFVINSEGVELTFFDNLATALGAPIALELEVNGQIVYYVRNNSGEGLYDPISGITTPIETGAGRFWETPDPIQLQMIQTAVEAAHGGSTVGTESSAGDPRTNGTYTQTNYENEAYPDGQDGTTWDDGSNGVETTSSEYGGDQGEFGGETYTDTLSSTSTTGYVDAGTTTGSFEPSGGEWTGGNGTQNRGTPDPSLPENPDYTGVQPLILDLDGDGVEIAFGQGTSREKTTLDLVQT